MKKLIMILALALSVSAYGHSLSKTKTIKVTSIEVGDYCWLTGVSREGKSKQEETYLINTRPDKKICTSGDSKVETNLWKGKTLKVTIKTTKICEHLPPCEKGDTLISQPTIVDLDVIH